VALLLYYSGGKVAGTGWTAALALLLRVDARLVLLSIISIIFILVMIAAIIILIVVVASVASVGNVGGGGVGGVCGVSVYVMVSVLVVYWCCWWYHLCICEAIEAESDGMA
jgi:hypothetical protein